MDMKWGQEHGYRGIDIFGAAILAIALNGHNTSRKRGRWKVATCSFWHFGFAKLEVLWVHSEA